MEIYLPQGLIDECARQGFVLPNYVKACDSLPAPPQVTSAKVAEVLRKISLGAA